MILTLNLYDHIYSRTLGAGLGLASARLALVSVDYTPDLAHTSWAASAEPHEIAGAGYTAGGMALGGSVTPIGDEALFDAGNVVWSSLAATFAHAVLYSADDLIGWMTFNAGMEIVVTGYDFVVQWSESGIIKSRSL